MRSAVSAMLRMWAVKSRGLPRWTAGLRCRRKLIEHREERLVRRDVESICAISDSIPRVFRTTVFPPALGR